ncbi:hypothetical protein Patl1_28793 [Pistacia atlantica]|uniref:Uncharacterized protein n=1 Tax=Pistacia atlantica TaxID=434234 RepID=A0ACC1BC01_9ROSI|nr:hypothetical protein Patl1_28793 [Pistacia atlantica]
MPPSHEPSAVATLIQICSSISSLKRARQLHALILTTATPINVQTPYLLNNVITMYSRCGSLRDAQRVFDGMPSRSLVSYNALIAAYSRDSNCGNMAVKLMSRMEYEYMRPNGSTFTSLVQAALSLEDRLMGSLLHNQVMKHGFLNNICVQTSLLGMYSSCGDLASAKRIFACINNKDAIAWNSIIFGNFKNDMINEGLYLFGAMVRSGVTPNQFTYSMVLNACSRVGDYNCGKFIHGRVIVSNLNADLPLQNALLDMYFNCGATQTAFSVFSRSENVDLVSWNTMIAGYMENGDGEKAMDMFVQLLRLSFPEPDEYTFAAIISATCAFPASYYGKPLHALVSKAGYDRSVFVGTALLSVYFKNGEAKSSEKIFHLISEKDVVLWTEMIIGHSRMGDEECAIKYFCEMCQEGHKIDSFALSGALSACADLASLKQACSHSGFVERGKVLWNHMKEYGIIPGPKHYACMVSLLSRAGLLNEAENLIIEAPYNENLLELWRTLLSSCVINRNFMMGTHAAEQVLGLDSEDSATYILLSNLYAAVGRWDGVAAMRRKMRGLVLEKDPGLSWIEAGNDVHVFSSGDQSHPKVGETQAELHRLQGNMRKSITDEFDANCY